MDTIVTPVTVITLDSTRIVHSIKADLVARYFPPVVRLVQYDQSLPVIAVSLMQNGQTYTLPIGAAANIRVHKPDATYVYNPALGCDSTRNIVYFEVTQAMAAANGDGLAIVEIVVDGDIAGTSLITLHFEENPVPEDAIESSDEWETIYELGERIIASTVTPVSTAAGMTDHNVVYLYTGTESGWNQGHMYYYNGTTWVDAGIAVTDKTLTVEGLAADAKKTGEEIADLKDGLTKLYEPYNLYDKDSAEDGYFTAPDGSNASNSSWCRLRRVYVTAGDTISITGGRFMTCFFSADTLNPSDVISGGADYSSGQALITVPSGATVMSVSALVANKSKMLVVKSDKIVTEYLPYGTVKPADTFDVYSKEEVDDFRNATITVVTIGTDYENLRLALEDIATKNTSYKNRYLVKIPKGTYDIRSLFTSTELATTKGLYVPPFTKIQGVGNPSEVVLNWINPSANSVQSVLNLDCTAELENLTLHGEKLRYALHDDWTVRKWDGVTPYSEYWYEAFVNKGWVRTVRNCIFDVIDSPVRPAWGAGVVNGVRWLFENCTFITNKAYAGSCHNDTNFSMPCHIVFRNCIFTAADTYFLRLTSITNNANGIINQATFEGCMNTNSLKFILTEEDATNLGRGCLWAVNGFGNAFGNAKGQISVTDGQDYSSRLKLVG